MINAIRSYLSYRASVRRNAKLLIQVHGANSYEVSRDLAFTAMADKTQPDRAWHVNAVVERLLGVYHQPDTASRYLDGARRAGRHPWMW